MLKAFAPEGSVDRPAAEGFLRDRGLAWTVTVHPPQNWNAVWESGFEPVVVEGFCTVRADFHPPATETPYEVVITPKMSFGTGHHATTRLMMEQLRDLPVRDSAVLDFGTGTGVLAILAEKLGAASVLALDNDAWSVENAAENLVTNGSARVAVRAGSLEEAYGQEFDLVLANINRHILLRYFPRFAALLRPGGRLVMSGLLLEDRPLLEAAGVAEGWEKDGAWHGGNWLCLRFKRNA